MMNTTAMACIRRLSGLFALSLFLTGLLAIPARAQEDVAELEECAGGTYYLLAFPDTTTNTWDARFPAQLLRTNTTSFTFYIYSPVDQLATIGRVNGAGERISLTGGQIYEYDTEDIGVPLVTVINTPQSNVLRIETEYPVVVYGYQMTAFGTEGFTAIPVESWGTEYVTSAWPGEVLRDVFPNGEFNYRAVPKEGEGEILIIAAYDNTQVRISPKAVLRECAGCTQVTLKAGEAYLVQSTVDTSAGAERQPDISGTFIQSSKRIGVITGNPRVMHNKGVRPSLGENSFMNMAIEWIPPIEQHGTEFVFMPTWDDRRQRDGLDPDESRDVEHVRVYATTMNADGEGVPTEVTWRDNLGQDNPAVTPVVAVNDQDGRFFTHEKIGLPVARRFKTSEPAMAYSSPNAVVKFNGTTTWGANYVGASYLSWSTYMVELVPREQWSSFAPVRAPSLPSSMVHYLNLVTDTNDQFNVYYRQGSSPPQIFPFNRGIVPGTDLVWGSIPLNKGVDYFIEGDKGAMFSGFAYGSYRGQEQYRPGANKKKDDGKGSAVAGGGDGDAPEVLHPSEYEEDVALMYGFPLAPSRCVLAPPDEYEITTEQECEVMNITIKAKNNPASGIRSITMLPDSSENVRLEFIKPVNPLDLKSQKIVEAELRLVAINPQRDARAVIVIRDRTRESKRWRVVYNWEAERVDIVPTEVDFGEVTINTAAGERVVTITNPLPTKDVVVKRLSLVLGNQGFVITRTDPNFNWRDNNDSVVLKPGESLKVWVDITPTEERAYLDSLRIQLGCVVVAIPLKAATALPCIFVSDLDFGTMNIAAGLRRLPLEICNTGKGSVTFQDPWLTWLQTEAKQQGFDVAQAEIDKLKGTTLTQNQCVTIEVTFTPPTQKGEGGSFRTTARFWASTRDCRDTSIWRATVLEPGPQIDPYNWGERWLSEDDCTKNPEERYLATIQARNEGESPFEVVGLTIENDPDGVFAIVNTTVTPGLVMQPTDKRDIQVSFDPKDEKVYYTPQPELATIRLSYKINLGDRDSTGFVEQPLEGIGIESYVSISDQSFGRHQYTGAGSVVVPSTVIITASGTRPVNIDQVVLNTATDFRFPQAWLDANTWAVNAQDNDVLTLAPGATQVVELEFMPQNVNTLDKRATIDLIGDFAYDVCSVSDSTGALDGQVFSLDAEIEGFDFGSILTCYERDGFITVRNLSTDPVQITNIGRVLPANMATYFDVNTTGATITLPHTLQPAGSGNDVVQIPVHFAPNGAAAYDATVEVTVMNMDGTTEVAVLTAPLAGEARTITVNMSIADDYTQFPGLPLSIPVLLDQDPAEAQVTDFLLNLEYDDGMMLLNAVKLGELFPESEGWVLEITDKRPGSLTVRIYNTAGRFVQGTGEALVLDYITYIGDVTETAIPFNVTPLKFGTTTLANCIDFTTTPGAAKLDSVCGLNFRLIELTSSKYSVGQARPNIVRSTTDIEFSIGLDAATTIEIFNQNGDKVGVLVDQYLQPGSYSVTWNASLLPSGKYFYRITSGHWTGTNELIIRK